MSQRHAVKEKFIEVSSDSYVGPDSMTMTRERYRGSALYGLWVLRDADNEVLDQDSNRHDLMERNNFRI